MICIFWCFKRAAHYLRLSQSVYSIVYSKKKWLLFIPSNLCHRDREVLVTSFLSLGIPFLPQQHMGIKKCNESMIMASIWTVLGFLEPYSNNWKMHAVGKGLYSETEQKWRSVWWESWQFWVRYAQESLVTTKGFLWWAQERKKLVVRVICKRPFV